jgi:hypothetical protein
MTITRPRRFLTLLFAAVALAVAAMIVSFEQPHAAHASTTTGNPWNYTMTNPNADGLVIHGTTGTTNPFLVFDHLGQPIAAIGEAGGFKVLGDCSSVNLGSDIYYSQVTMCGTDPNPSICVRAGQLWLGGAGGHLWRCESRNGDALAWSQLL